MGMHNFSNATPKADEQKKKTSQFFSSEKIWQSIHIIVWESPPYVSSEEFVGSKVKEACEHCLKEVKLILSRLANL